MKLGTRWTLTASLCIGSFASAALAQTSEPRPGKRDPDISATDNQFIKEAAAAGMAEVELGQLAVAKASRPEVKRFGQMMVADHGKANAELKRLAAKKTVTLPTEPKAEHEAEKERLSKLSGKAFDDAFIKRMTTDHAQAIDLFSHQAMEGNDADAKAWAAKRLPVIRRHASRIKEITEKTPADTQP